MGLPYLTLLVLSIAALERRSHLIRQRLYQLLYQLLCQRFNPLLKLLNQLFNPLLKLLNPHLKAKHKNRKTKILSVCSIRYDVVSNTCDLIRVLCSTFATQSFVTFCTGYPQFIEPNVKPNISSNIPCCGPHFKSFTVPDVEPNFKSNAVSVSIFALTSFNNQMTSQFIMINSILICHFASTMRDSTEEVPTFSPTVSPTLSPTLSPAVPTGSYTPTLNPTVSPTVSPTFNPTSSTYSPTKKPTAKPV